MVHHAGSASRLMRVDFVCECSSPGCTESVSLLTTEYDELIGSGGWVLAYGHAAPNALRAYDA